jgi:hypothetical protein
MEPTAFANLIRLAFECRGDWHLRNSAGLALLQYLAGLALLVAPRDSALREELVGHVEVQCGRGMYEPRAATKPDAWVLTIMRNYRAGLARRILREASGDDALAGLSNPRDVTLTRDMRIDLTTRFCDEDDRRVRAWTARQRVILLPWWLLWRKAEQTYWAQTVAVVRLEQPFPSDHFEWMAEGERTAYLAQTLGVTHNAINQALGRGRDKVFSLRFMRELRGDD